MSEQLLLSICAAATFIAALSAYLGLREFFERQALPSKVKASEPVRARPDLRRVRTQRIAGDRAA